MVQVWTVEERGSWYIPVLPSYLWGTASVENSFAKKGDAEMEVIKKNCSPPNRSALLRHPLDIVFTDSAYSGCDWGFFVSMPLLFIGCHDFRLGTGVFSCLRCVLDDCSLVDGADYEKLDAVLWWSCIHWLHRVKYAWHTEMLLYARQVKGGNLAWKNINIYSLSINSSHLSLDSQRSRSCEKSV